MFTTITKDRGFFYLTSVDLLTFDILGDGFGVAILIRNGIVGDMAIEDFIVLEVNTGMGWVGLHA